MSRTNTFFWILHRRVHAKQSLTDLVKYVQYMVCGHNTLLNKIGPETGDLHEVYQYACNLFVHARRHQPTLCQGISWK